MQFSESNQFSEDAHQGTENTSGQENRGDRERERALKDKELKHHVPCLVENEQGAKTMQTVLEGSKSC